MLFFFLLLLTPVVCPFMCLVFGEVTLDFNLQEHSRPDLEFSAKRVCKAVGFNLSHDHSPHL